MNGTGCVLVLMQNSDKQIIMCKRINILFFIIVFLSALNCWQKQDHEITRPEVPHYILSGKTIDYDTQKSLPHTTIKIQPVQLLYDVQFNTALIESDSNGNFALDPIYPGDYTLTVYSGDSWHSSRKFGITHADRDITIKVPKIIFSKFLLKKYTGNSSNEFYYPMENAAFGIAESKCFINCNRVWGSVTNPAIVVLNLKWNNWYYEKSFTPSLNYNNIRNMTIGMEKIYILTKDDSILTMNRWTGYQERIGKVPENIFGLTFNTIDKNLYACSHTEIFRLNPVDYSITNTYSTSSQYLNAMAFNKNIYTYDNIEYLLRFHDENMNVLTTYAIIDPNSRYQIKNIYDFDFDTYNNLWIMVN